MILIIDGPDVGSNRGGFDIGKTGHTGEPLPQRGFGGLELAVDGIGGSGSREERDV